MTRGHEVMVHSKWLRRLRRGSAVIDSQQSAADDVYTGRVPAAGGRTPGVRPSTLPTPYHDRRLCGPSVQRRGNTSGSGGESQRTGCGVVQPRWGRSVPRDGARVAGRRLRAVVRRARRPLQVSHVRRIRQFFGRPDAAHGNARQRHATATAQSWRRRSATITSATEDCRNNTYINVITGPRI